MPALELTRETVHERLARLIEPHGGSWPLRHTTTTAEAIAGLIARNQQLEEAVREISDELQRLAADYERLAAHPPD